MITRLPDYDLDIQVIPISKFLINQIRACNLFPLFKHLKHNQTFTNTGLINLLLASTKQIRFCTNLQAISTLNLPFVAMVMLKGI